MMGPGGIGGRGQHQQKVSLARAPLGTLPRRFNQVSPPADVAAHLAYLASRGKKEATHAQPTELNPSLGDRGGQRQPCISLI